MANRHLLDLLLGGFNPRTVLEARADQYRRRDVPEGQTKSIDSIKIVTALDEDPDLSHLDDPERYKGEKPEDVEKYTQQDKERMDSYGDSWNMIGIYAEAQVTVRGVMHKLKSGGLWGIESDSDKSYFKEVAQEEYNDLVEQLKELGFNPKDIPPFDDVEWVDWIW